MISRSANLRRLSFVLLAAEQNHYLTQLPAIQEKLVDILRTNVVSPRVHSEVGASRRHALITGLLVSTYHHVPHKRSAFDKLLARHPGGAAPGLRGHHGRTTVRRIRVATAGFGFVQISGFAPCDSIGRLSNVSSCR